MSEPPLLNLPLLGRRSVLRLLGVAALGLVASCRPGKQRSAPTSSAASTAAAGGSSRPAAPASPAQAGASQPTVSALSADQLVAQRVAAAEQDTARGLRRRHRRAPRAGGPARAVPCRPCRAPARPRAWSYTLDGGAEPSPSNSAPQRSAPTFEHTDLPAGTTAASAPPTSPPASTAILRQLADLERAAAQARVDDVVTTSGSLARFVASIGGCEAAHAALLSVAT